MIDGTYGFVFCGAYGLGPGLFTVKAGLFLGVDLGGLQYVGTAQEKEDGSIFLNLSLSVPAAQTPQTRRIRTTLPAAFGDGKPQEIAVEGGTITFMVKRVRDDFLTEGKNITPGDAYRLATGSDVYFKGRS